MIINQPWWQMLGVLLLIAIIAIVFAGLTGEEDVDDHEQPADAGRSDRRGPRFAGRLGRSIGAVLSLGLRRRQPAVDSTNILRRVSGPDADATWDKPREHLRGLTADEELELQRYLHLLKQTAGAVNSECWSVSDAVHEIAGIKARNTPERSVQFGTGNQFG